GESELSQFSKKRRGVHGKKVVTSGGEETNMTGLSGLLRARPGRPRRRGAEGSQQLPPSPGGCHTPPPREVRQGKRYHATSVLSLTARHPARAERLDFKIYFRPRRRPCTHKRAHWPNVRSRGEPETPQWRE